MNPAPTRAASSLPTFVVVVAMLAAAGYFGWRYFGMGPTPESADVPVAVVPQEPLQPLQPLQPLVTAPSATETAALPTETLTTTATVAEPAPASALPAVNDSDPLVAERLTGLLGRKSVLSFLQLDGFVRRAVATVDNLARSQAPAKIWPVNPTPQRFTTLAGANGVETIHPDNSQRYAPLVQMIESVNIAQAVAVYRGMQPLFQRAYEELGFPGKQFNLRLLEVLDHLIATPVPAGPLAVTLVEVKGPIPSVRPWVRYEYANPELEAMSAGRKILMRTGPANQRRLQNKLAEIRQHLARP